MATQAVLLDALGTTIELEPPWPRLASKLQIPADERLIAGFRAEMSYYRDHAHEAVDDSALADLRRRCAALLSGELGLEVSVDQMMAAIRFRAYDDAAPALDRLGELGLRRVCVSNWDYALPAVLERCGLGCRFDAVITSAGSGARKPDPEIFRLALAAAGCGPSEAVHVGDTPEEDIAGARAAGIPALLLDRRGGGEIASLVELAERIGG